MSEFVPLRKNQRVELADGRSVTVTGKLGEGGQGIVYRVRFDTGEERALKWFFVGYLNDPQKFYNHLASNIKIGAPSDAFVWPEQLTKWINGEPTDDYLAGLQKLKENNWYKIAVRVAVGYGESNDDVLREFTMNAETVIHTDNPAELKKMIKFIAVTSSRVASKGGNVQSGDNNTQSVAVALKTQGGSLNASADEEW